MQVIDLKKTPTTQAIEAAVKVLKAGGLVIYPTETVYGGGVDATHQTAVNKLLAYKSRREGKPLSIAVANQEMAQEYAQLNQQAIQFYKKFLPGPYTIISQAKNKLASGVASEFKTVGIRIPDYPLILKLVKKLGNPITATSANASGKKRPYTIQDIFDHLSAKQKKLIDLVLDAGQLPPNEPSTVIDTTLSTPLTLRGKLMANKEQTSSQFISRSERETQDIAGKFMLKYWNQLKEKGLVVGLSGELGAGKTIFAKGIGRFLKINQIITSPTYNYIKEHDFSRHNVNGTFYHIDTWKLDNQEETSALEIPDLIQPKNIVAIEWWTQVKQFMPSIKPDLVVNLKVIDEKQRQIQIYEKPST
jgi:L-threonylcarbamoyladenylate synthase